MYKSFIQKQGSNGLSICYSTFFVNGSSSYAESAGCLLMQEPHESK